MPPVRRFHHIKPNTAPPTAASDPKTMPRIAQPPIPFVSFFFLSFWAAVVTLGAAVVVVGRGCGARVVVTGGAGATVVVTGGAGALVVVVSGGAGARVVVVTGGAGALVVVTRLLSHCFSVAS